MEDKLILICSDVSEASTDVVCSWLAYYGKKFVRISSNNVITIKRIIIDEKNEDILFSIDNLEYMLSDFKSYWYRRSHLKFADFKSVEFNYEVLDLSCEVSSFLKKEYSKVIEYFVYKLDELAVLNKFDDNNINKLRVLSLAKCLNLKIPSSNILDDLKVLDLTDKRYVTKAISDFMIKKDGKVFYSMTQKVNCEDGENMFYSLVQEEITKKFEIRSFFFNNYFYSSAIFSQENEKTSLDFRNYDHENPNRVVPFKLPNFIEEKLLQLCKILELKSGSFDLAYTKNGDYVLFEVNPVGQFEQVSDPCNYNIHKEIALSL
ncbi:MAG TPA: grasp-with-spasm system ATP-grasp peptide maturase [Flavobacterium sp.]|uniref:grasp-with-spasm system ATP-grasp peptide maturase n=1 Tax=Flavobacterium sp. TaxID=239 RepID=UPI002C5569BB|nr:grasp-with-spasm system ATP-grasp peptide maturase [Flavobacterium sp.]HSD14686.1 grasp-with-spasm system ATP-grasp peptide maturase [Flavobacterium sp.]